jgi:hypothetical protein
MAASARAVLLLAPVLLALAALAPVERAHACSILGFPGAVPNLVDDSTVAIAVGEFGASHGDAIEFHVTDPIRGTAEGQVLLVNNRELELSAGCDVLLGTPGSVRFSSGEQVLLFLEADDLGVGADWRPAHFGYAVTHLKPDGAFPSVALVRELVTAGPPYSGPTPRPAAAPPTPPPAGTPAVEPRQAVEAEHSSSDSFPWSLAVAGVATLLVAAAVAYAWRRHAASRRR